MLQQMPHEAGQIAKGRSRGPALRAAEDAPEGPRGPIRVRACLHGQEASRGDVRLGEEGPAVADARGGVHADAGVECFGLSCRFGS